jgi:hypothetical protein
MSCSNQRRVFCTRAIRKSAGSIRVAPPTTPQNARLPPQRKSLAEYLRHPVRHDGKFNALLGVGWMGLAWMGLGETRRQEKSRTLPKSAVKPPAL